MSALRAITVTEQDICRLSDLASLYADRESAAAESLLEELGGAVIVSPAEVHPSVVTMNSRICCRDNAGMLHEIELVYPWRADASAGRISVLAPLGRALLGASEGDHVEVVRRGKVATWLIDAVRYQPEAAGDFHL